MFKNQLQELAQRCSFNLPSYSCIREGPDHAPRFKSTVAFNGESFESPGFCNTLRQAEHAAAEVALSMLSRRGSTQSLAARILDDTGFCKNLLQETAQRAGISLPIYSIERSGPGHIPIFISTVQLAGMSFVGEAAKTKKQAEKNAATAAWTSLKELVIQQSSAHSHPSEEQMQMAIVSVLVNAAEESGTVTVRQTPPQSSRPVTTSRITIKPLKEQPGQAKVDEQSPSSSKAVTKSRITITPLKEQPGQAKVVEQSPSSSRAVTTSRITITPLEEEPCQAAMVDGQGPLSQSSIDANAAHMISQSQGLGSPNLKDGTSPASSYKLSPGSSMTASGVMLSEIGNVLQQQKVEPTQAVIVNCETQSHVTFIPINQLQSYDKNLFIGATTYIVANGSEVGTSNSVPVVHPGYTAVMWTGENQPRMDAHAAFKPAISLAPCVHVRQAIPVFSAPPCLSEVKDQGTEASEAVTRKDLSNLKL